MTGVVAPCCKTRRSPSIHAVIQTAWRPSQIDVFVRDAPPEPLHEDVIQGPSASVHADGHAVRLKDAGEGVSGELATLIGVEDLGDAVARQGVRQSCHTEPALQRIR